MRGGYPEAFKRDKPNRCSSWYESYIRTPPERDVRNLDTVNNSFVLRRLITYLSLNVGSTLNFTNVALKLQVSLPTVN